MSEVVLIDTGPLVAYLVEAAEHHEWAVAQWKLLTPPLYTCEPVLAEAGHLLRRESQSAQPLLDLMERRVVQVAFYMENEIPSLKQLIHRYRNLPMSLADASLVRMSELRDRSLVMTTDSDFLIYRRHGRHVIPVLMPPEQ